MKFQLFNQRNCETKIVILSYNHYTRGFGNMFKDLGIAVASKMKQTLEDLLGNRKD